MTERYNDDMQNERIELLKDYLKRLGKGEALEVVRADFVQNFKDVDASEIMQAEQQMIQEGTPITEVQKLCDVHSALFHGETREEKIANAEKAVDASLIRQERAAKTKLLVEEKGHPLYTFLWKMKHWQYILNRREQKLPRKK